MSLTVIAEIEDVPVIRGLTFNARIVRRTYPAVVLGARVNGRDPENPDNTQTVAWVYGSLWRYGFGLGFDWTVSDAERAFGDEVRGVMRDFETEISDIERWKAEAIEVLAAWDEVADLIPVKLGESKAAAVKAWVLRTSAEVEELTESLANVRVDLNYAISDRLWNRGGKP